MTDRIYVGTRKGLFTYARGRDGQWQIVQTDFLGDPVTMVLPRDNGALFAALNLGHFGAKLRRLRTGHAWTECAVPAFTAGVEVATADGTKKPASVALIWSLESARAPRSLWAGTIPGGLFRSHDDGESWELVEALWNRPEREQWMGGGYDLPGIHSICVDPRDPRRVTVGVSTGGVWATADDGAHWESRALGMRAAYMPPERAYDQNVQDPHRVVQCASAPDAFWAQHHNGIFRSQDNAASWQEIAEAGPSTFGFAVAVHPQHADTAWFVPAVKDETRVPVAANMAVTRTRDGGKTFDTLRAGLPQGHAYDLVYRHGLDVDATGTRLAMGSTTGGLWLSEDAGDAWQTLSTHLPPIYCVRFAKM